MRNAGLEEAQAEIKIAGRNINNLTYADDTTLIAEIEELTSLWMKLKEESEEFGLKHNIQKTKIMASFEHDCQFFSIVRNHNITVQIQKETWTPT